MFSENIGNDYIVIQEGTSEGTQVKYKKDGYWYKKDNRGNEVQRKLFKPFEGKKQYKGI